MIIVSGRIFLRPGTRQRFLTSSVEAVARARRTRGCFDFAVSADPIDPDRVNVYEQWESEEALLAFRGEGPDEDLTSNIERAEVSRHVVSSSGPA